MRTEPDTVQKRLDYALVNDAFEALWPITSVTHLPRYRSDPNPLIICCGSHGMHELRRTRMFRFEELWLKDEECLEVVTEAWSGGANLHSRLSVAGSSLLKWGREKFGGIPKKISDTKGYPSTASENGSE